MLIAAVLLIGLAAPPVFMAWFSQNLKQDALVAATDAELENLIHVLADGMRTPVWELIPENGKPLMDSLISDPRIFSIEVKSLAQKDFLDFRRAAIAPERLVHRQLPIMRNGSKIGEVAVDIDLSAVEEKLESDWQPLLLAVLAQLIAGACAVVFIYRASGHLARENALIRANEQLKSEISEREQFSAALKASEDRLRSITDAMPLVLIYLDSDLRYQFVNKVGEIWYARPAAEIIGETVANVFGEGDEPHQGLSTRVAGLYRRAAAGESVSFEGQVKYPDGITRDIYSVYIADSASDGSTKGVFVMVQDITNRRQSELLIAEQRKLFLETINAAPLVITIKDADQRFVFNNHYSTSRFNLSPSAFVGKTIGEVLGDVPDTDIVPMVAARDAKVIATGKAMPFYEEKIIINATPAIMMTSKTPIFGDDGDVRYVLTVALDITELKRAEEDRRFALAQAEHANLAKSQFLATMSHELRTPLNAIIGFSQIMTHEFFGPIGSPQYRQYAEDICSSSNLLLSLVNDILDLSAIEAGERALSKKDLKIGGLIDECVQIILAEANNKGIEVEVAVEAQIPTLFADERAVKQILLNILSNAVKYTPEDGRIEFRASAADGQHLFEVIDTGVGVPEDRLASLTDRFVRGEADPHKAAAGSGLGLAIVKSLVEQHDGELKIESELGEGTVVRVRMPSSAR